MNKLVLIILLYNFSLGCVNAQTLTANNPGTDIIYYRFIKAPTSNLHLDASSGKDLFLNHYGGNNIKFGPNGNWMIVNSQGKVGVGTTNPLAIVHFASNATQLNSHSSNNANLILEAKSSARSISEGAAIGFSVPANIDGSGLWQQGRIIVTPDNGSNQSAYGRMYLQTRKYDGSAWSWVNNLVLRPTGNVGIGTTNPTEKLVVDGKILAEEVKVQAVPSSDYVFEPDYELKPLYEVNLFIQENKHLPDIPSAEEFATNGVGLGEMDNMLLRKVEELTLYMIELKRENELLNQKNTQQDIIIDDLLRNQNHD